jgi:hypothetical protein
MKNFSQFIQEALYESSRVQWHPAPNAKVGEDGKVSINDIPQIIKTNDRKKPKPGEGHVECPTCDSTGRVVAHTGRVGRNPETGEIEAQYLEQSCRTCKGHGHLPPHVRKGPHQQMKDFLNDPNFPNRGD